MEDILFYDNYDDLITRLSKTFPDIHPEETRDILFFLNNFIKEHELPEETLFFKAKIPISGLEVRDESRVSEVFVGGIEKFESLNYNKKSIPPVVVLSNSVRNIIIHGETYVIEAHTREQPLSAIILDIGDNDPLQLLHLDPFAPRFILPLIEKITEES